MKRNQFTFYRSYFEALRSLPRREVTETILAICSYALDGEEPQLDGVPMAMFTLIRPTLDSGMKQAQRRMAGAPCPDPAAIGERSRRHKRADADAISERSRKDRLPPADAFTDGGEREKEKETEREGEEDPLRACAGEAHAAAPYGMEDDELTLLIEDNRHADELIRRYHLPDCDTSREALLEDAERTGWDALEAALRRAAEANSRPMLSVNYYRAMLTGGKGGGDAGGGSRFPSQLTL